MIDSTPRLLPRQRLEQLVHGLRERLSSGAEKISAELDHIAVQMKQAETDQQQQFAQLQSEREATEKSTINAWDETLHARWDDAELRSFKAVFETSAREGQLRQDTRKRSEQVNIDAKKRMAEIEQRFLRAKDVPIRRLHEFRANNLNFMGELMEVERAAEAALAQHSLRAPSVQPPELHYEKPQTADDCLRLLRASIADAKVHYDRLTNHPLIRFFESIWLWLIAAAFFVAVTVGLGVSGVVVWLFAALGGAVATVALMLISLLGIRPWLKRIAAAEYPRVKQQVAHGKALHDLGAEMAAHENDAELKRLAAKRDARYQQTEKWRVTELSELTRRLDEDLEKLRLHAEQQKQAASHQLTTERDSTTQRFTQQLEQLTQQALSREQNLKQVGTQLHQDFLAQMDRLNRGGALRLRTATQKAIKTVTRSRRWCNVHFPDWQSTEWTADSWPEQLDEPMLPIGNLPLTSLLPENLQTDNEADLDAPVYFAPLTDGYLTITGDPKLPIIQQTVRNLILRSLTTLPPGRTQVCVIDPQGLGRDYGWLMHLGDYDPQLVSHRVWTQPGHIAKQVQLLAQAAEDFIQQSLRNQYRHIVEYNRDAGALAEPFRLLVWTSMPTGLDDQSWKALQSLLDTGTRCGIIPIFLIDPAAPWPSADHKNMVMRRGLHYTVSEDGKSLQAVSETKANLPVRPMPLPDEAHAQTVIHEVGRRALLASRIEVPLDRIVPAPDQRWQADSSKFLEIPIGQSGVGRTHSLKLGVGTAQHAIVAGKTGSGKSSMLHAIISSAVLKYSPENLRLVLLDFKKGVEFQVYSDNQLPHADIIGIESHREFGLSALEYVDGCMQRRGEMFRSRGVQDIASWNAAVPEQHLPRMLIVVDEFQELFVEDDKLSNQVSLILDRIVRQGRSFGVHAILSSQTLAGAYSLPRTTLGQMGVRIALQCDASDAQIVFAEDNPAAARLKNPGQAIYNDAGGRIEGNQPMQIGWLSKTQQQQWLAEIGKGYSNADPTTNILGRSVVYDGNRAATWTEENANRAINEARRDINPEAIWCVVGESVAISPAITFPLTNQAGRNVLIVGGVDAIAASVMSVITASFVRHAKDKHRSQVYIAQAAKPTDAKALQMPERLKHLPCDLKVADVRGVDAMLKELHQILKQRIEQPDDASTQVPVLVNLIQLGRLRSLRREDEFGMGSFGDAELTPDKHLEEILRDGPSHNMHVVVWAENYSTVNRWLSRTAMREIEIRLLMQMGANDSTNLIESVAASRLGENVMLVHDEATGQDQGFRPFDFDTLGELSKWVG
ncbi:MAG: FtsK/SpoIIIE domain-containing protein [Pirellulaceae bacterium]|nr:FtsK/SpoIIIE domain-containing protein [Pirellulaceae bacterium]